MQNDQSFSHHSDDNVFQSYSNIRNIQSIQKASVAIFWDAESVKPPSGISGSTVATCIRNYFMKFGFIEECNAYADLSKTNWLRDDPNFRTEMERGGVRLMQTTHKRETDVADLILTTDMMFTWGKLQRYTTQPPVIVLIACDSDYTYPLNKLRGCGCQTHLVLPVAHPSGGNKFASSYKNVSQRLKDAAEFMHYWEDILHDTSPYLFQKEGGEMEIDPLPMQLLKQQEDEINDDDQMKEIKQAQITSPKKKAVSSSSSSIQKPYFGESFKYISTTLLIQNFPKKLTYDGIKSLVELVGPFDHLQVLPSSTCRHCVVDYQTPSLHDQIAFNTLDGLKVGHHQLKVSYKTGKKDDLTKNNTKKQSSHHSLKAIAIAIRLANSADIRPSAPHVLERIPSFYPDSPAYFDAILQSLKEFETRGVHFPLILNVVFYIKKKFVDYFERRLLDTNPSIGQCISWLRSYLESANANQLLIYGGINPCEWISLPETSVKLPQHPDKAPCWEFHTSGECQQGSSCEMNHPIIFPWDARFSPLHFVLHHYGDNKKHSLPLGKILALLQDNHSNPLFRTPRGFNRIPYKMTKEWTSHLYSVQWRLFPSERDKQNKDPLYFIHKYIDEAVSCGLVTITEKGMNSPRKNGNFPKRQRTFSTESQSDEVKVSPQKNICSKNVKKQYVVTWIQAMTPEIIQEVN